MQRLAVIHALSVILAVLFAGGCGNGGKGSSTNYARCLTCHQGIERISENHPFDCSRCHLLPGDRKKALLPSHDEILRNPSAPPYLKSFCLPCHREEVERLDNSLHGTLAGVINQTRYLWGAQQRASPAEYGLGGPFKPLPEPDDSLYPENPERLVDDFLRRKCLRCHIYSPGHQARGLYRAAGCAACHVVYADDGRYRGGDRAVDASHKGYPVRHEFTLEIPNQQCLHCHNQNHVGADYEGFFEQDYSITYRPPKVKGRSLPDIYGMGYHRLAKDVHARRGLQCIDCHGGEDVMGNGRAYSFELEAPKKECTDCHPGFEDPSFSEVSVHHSVPEHHRVRCSACHAQWSFQDYGFSVIREDIIKGYKWYGLAAQGDPELEKKLKRHFPDRAPWNPVSKDYISDESRLGIWSQGWRFRRWEFMPLGVDQKGQYAVLRPLYQYLITYVDRLGNIPLDSTIPQRGDQTGKGWAFMPYVPHTISPLGRPCCACHKNRIAVGLGMQEHKTKDTLLTVPSPPAIRSMRLLTEEERTKLLEPSRRWGRLRLKAMTGKN